MIALWHIDSKTSELRKEDNGYSGKRLYNSVCSMISTGTEKRVASGGVDLSLQDAMKVPYQKGSFDLPIKYGYSLIVEDHEGKLGHLMHPHQDQIWMDEENIFWFGDELTAEKGALISNMETVLNAIWDSRVSKNQTIAVCGFGNIGSLLANTLRTYLQRECAIIETNEWRRQKAVSLGWHLHQEEHTYDVIFHNTATSEGLQYCLDHLNYEGQLIELSWYGSKEVTLKLGSNFHVNRLKIISSQVSTIPGHMRHLYDYTSRKKLAVKILKDDSFDHLITHRIPFDDAPQFFNALRSDDTANGLIYIIDYTSKSN